MRWLVPVAYVAAGTLLLASCGSGSADDDAVAALTRAITEEPLVSGLELEESDAECVADAAVDSIGADRLTEVGLVGSEAADDQEPASGGGGQIDLGALSDDELESLGRALESCIDGLDSLLVDTVATAVSEGAGDGLEVDDDQARCVAELVVEDFSVPRMVTVGIRADLGDEPFSSLSDSETEDLVDSMLACIDIRGAVVAGVAEAGVAQDVVDCLGTSITDADVRTLLLSVLRGEDSTATATALFTPAIESCT